MPSICKCRGVVDKEDFEIYDVGSLSDRHLVLTSVSFYLIILIC